MGLFGEGKKELDLALELGKLQSENEFLRRENNDLRKDNDRLKEKVDRQMDTIIAIQHPESYRALQDDKAVQGSFDLSAEEKNILRAEQKAWLNFADEQEKPLFRGPEDLLSLMSKYARSQGTPDQAGHSVHGNEES